MTGNCQTVLKPPSTTYKIELTFQRMPKVAFFFFWTSRSSGHPVLQAAPTALVEELGGHYSLRGSITLQNERLGPRGRTGMGGFRNPTAISPVIA